MNLALVRLAKTVPNAPRKVLSVREKESLHLLLGE